MEFPPESAPQAPPELLPAPPREPILTLPGALTAYVLLLAIIHLRVLLPPELENWTIDVFGFIPKRYDSTLLAIEQKTQARIEPWTAEQSEVGKSRFEIKGRKHGERLVEFFDASTVVEKEQAVDEGSFASGKQDIVGAPLRLQEVMGWGE